MRIYISGPMSGLKQEDYVNRFACAETGIRHDYKGCQVINPVAVTLYKQDMSYEELMQIDLDLLATCDAIYLMRGWSQSLGCNRELGYALGRDMIILREEGTRL
jgi:hypothetical protein